MTDEGVRGAYRRLADPLGTPLRAGLLVVALGLVAAFGLMRSASLQRNAILGFTVATAAVYLFLSFRARRTAAETDPAALRHLFLDLAQRRLRVAGSLPVRGVMWGALGAWSLAASVDLGRFPLFEDPAIQRFFGVAGLLFAARYLLEWGIELPRVRREVADLANSAGADRG